MIYIKSDDPVTNVTAVIMLLRWNAHNLKLKKEDGHYTPARVTLRRAAALAAQSPWSESVAKHGVLSEQSSGSLHVTTGHDRGYEHEVRSSKDVKNLICIMLEERGVSRQKARRNWTMLRKHVTRELKEKGLV